jgi:uncharacterized phiE125 gp8 family phage protein
MPRVNAFAPRRVIAPAVTPVTLAEAKAHLRVEHSETDTQIENMIKAATSHLDGWSGLLGRCLIDQGWEARLAQWPTDRVIDLPFPDCSAPIITYADVAGAEQVLAGAGYTLIEGVTGSQIAIFDDTVLPGLKAGHPAPVKVAFTAGYGAQVSDVPAALRHAILLLVGDMWLARESFMVGARVGPAGSAATVANLIAGFRRTGLAGLA